MVITGGVLKPAGVLVLGVDVDMGTEVVVLAFAGVFLRSVHDGGDTSVVLRLVGGEDDVAEGLDAEDGTDEEGDHGGGGEDGAGLGLDHGLSLRVVGFGGSPWALPL